MHQEQTIRYSRHIFLPEIGEVGQERLLSSKILLIGLGGLGSVIAYYLVASGVGTLFISDNELVELSNLQRQILYQTKNIGRLKTEAAKKNLLALNPESHIIPLTGLAPQLVLNNPHTPQLSTSFSHAINSSDIVIDASDNFATRYAVNALCVHYKKPLVSGSALGWEGQVATFPLHLLDSPCYACLYPMLDGTTDHQPRCNESGVVSPLVGVIGSMQALAVLKILLNLEKTADLCQLLRLNALHSKWYSTHILRDSACNSCHKC